MYSGLVAAMLHKKARLIYYPLDDKLKVSGRLPAVFKDETRKRRAEIVATLLTHGTPDGEAFVMDRETEGLITATERVTDALKDNALSPAEIAAATRLTVPVVKGRITVLKKTGQVVTTKDGKACLTDYLHPEDCQCPRCTYESITGQTE